MNKRTNKRICALPNEISSQQLCRVVDNPYQIQMCLMSLAWKFPDILSCTIFIMHRSSLHICKL